MRRYRISQLPALAERFGPVATFAQLRTLGVGGPLLTSAVRAGVLIRLRRAHYAVPGLATDCATAIRMGGRLGSMSAARSYGWWDGDDTRIHVSWPSTGNVAKPGRVQFSSPEERPAFVRHWRILRDPLDGEGAVWRESPEQTLAQVLLSCDRVTAIACADSAIRVGTLSRFQVAAVFVAMPRRVRRWERYVDGSPDSGLESIVRVWLIDRDIRFVHHAQIPGVGEVDFLVGRSLIIETDGKPGHDDGEGRRRDHARDTAAAISGHITIRLSYRQAMFDWRSCERQILEHLSRGDHQRVIR